MAKDWLQKSLKGMLLLKDWSETVEYNGYKFNAIFDNNYQDTNIYDNTPAGTQPFLVTEKLFIKKYCLKIDTFIYARDIKWKIRNIREFEDESIQIDLEKIG